MSRDKQSLADEFGKDVKSSLSNCAERVVKNPMSSRTLSNAHFDEMTRLCHIGLTKVSVAIDECCRWLRVTQECVAGKRRRKVIETYIPQ